MKAVGRDAESGSHKLSENDIPPLFEDALEWFSSFQATDFPTSEPTCKRMD